MENKVLYVYEHENDEEKFVFYADGTYLIYEKCNEGFKFKHRSSWRMVVEKETTWFEVNHYPFSNDWKRCDGNSEVEKKINAKLLQSIVSNELENILLVGDSVQ